MNVESVALLCLAAFGLVSAVIWAARARASSAEPTAIDPLQAGEVRWLEEDETGNPFATRVLDLTPVTKTMTSMSEDLETARRVISWRPEAVSDFDTTFEKAPPPIPCELRYPAASVLPDGLLFRPQTMEHKWVLALRGTQLIFARSWTGAVELVAGIRHASNELVVEEVRPSQEDGALAWLGDLVLVTDWLIRTLALGERSPLPVSPEAAHELEENPLLAFSLFGEQVLCVAETWEPKPPIRPIRSDGLLVEAARRGDHQRLRELVASGEAVDAPSTFAGYTALFVPMIQGDLQLLELLLELGADPNALADREQHALGVGVVHGAPLDCLQALVDAGADPLAVNVDGFGALHAAAESDNAEAVPWLLERGLDLELPTHRGHTPLLIACGLGHVNVVKALLDAGADRSATDPEGRDARSTAAHEGKTEVAAVLDQRS